MAEIFVDSVTLTLSIRTVWPSENWFHFAPDHSDQLVDSFKETTSPAKPEIQSQMPNKYPFLKIEKQENESHLLDSAKAQL